MGACHVLLTGEAFTIGSGRPQLSPRSPHSSGVGVFTEGAKGSLPSGREALGMKGLLCYGMGFGLLMAATRARIACKAEGEIAVKEKAEVSKIAYLDNVPRTIIEPMILEKILASTPREEWENPPEETPLYALKCYAEVYGPGKATKMGWWDFWNYKNDNAPNAEDLFSVQELDALSRYNKLLMKGQLPMAIPGPFQWWYNGALIQYRGKDRFAGDQMQTPVNASGFAKQFLANTAFYREGLKPWQRGLEIGMAHGYFLIGPFTSLGPLRNTPEAATVGLLCACAVIGMASAGGLINGSTEKPELFDKPGEPAGKGFIELINWHAVGGVGGAGFAHALLTVFGSG